MMRGDLAGAALDLEAALQRNPREAMALQLRSLLRTRQGDARRAAQDATAASAQSPRVAVLVVETFGEGIRAR